MFSTAREPRGSFRGKRVTVMGLGLFGGGRGVSEFFCREGAEVTVTDLKGREELRPSLDAMRDLPIRWVLGEHRQEDFLDADLVVPNPAVPRGAPLLQLCRRRGIALETEMNLFFKHCAGRICAVTGSNGKTTTTRLIAAMARRRWPRSRVGGNLGHSLLPQVESIRPDDWVVLELSSFQLEDLASLEERPEVSVVVNVTPNHLDRHGSYEEYLKAKKEIIAPGRLPGVAVLWGEDAVLRGWARRTAREVVYFGRTGSVLPRARGAWADENEGEVYWTDGAARRALFRTSDLQLPGRINLLNAAAAAAAATAMGVGIRDVREAIREFRAVEHRLQLFLEHKGVEYFDDSIATTPESTIAALEALGPGVLLICGGSSKGCPLGKLAEAIARRAKAAFLIGATAAEIRRALEAARPPVPIRMCGQLGAAVGAAMEAAMPGDRVVLSPSFPSYDQFANFEERGRVFKELVRSAARKKEPSSARRERGPPGG